MNWLDEIERRVERSGPVARVLIIATDGPTPRATGTAMLVWRDGAAGRIGRGEAEQRSIEIARKMIDELGAVDLGEAPAGRDVKWFRETARYSTGKVLGESSGGTVEVLIEVFGPAECAALARSGGLGAEARFIGRRLRSGEVPVLLVAGRSDLSADWRRGIAELMGRPHARLARTSASGDEDIVVERIEPPRPPFYVYGTGLVARALVVVLAGLPFEVIWVDTAPGNFPADVPAGVLTMASGDVEATARSARDGALHAVMTADHDLDLGVCREILRRGNFHYLGVIGSLLKRERLVGRLEADGIGAAILERLSCPVGLPQIKSKQPSVIAISIAAQALALLPPDA